MQSKEQEEFVATAYANKKVDFGLESSNYATHRPGFPKVFYDRLATFLDVKGKRVCDVGSGPGVIALELAKRGAHVVGLDIAANQIEAAKKQAIALGVQDLCTWDVATAENTKQPDSHFDLVTAGTCWHWFDRVAAPKEMRRILAPGGLLVIAQYIYLAEKGSLAWETEEILKKYNPTWPLYGVTGLFPEFVMQVTDAGFELVEQYCIDYAQPFTQEGWFGRIQTCNGVGSGGLSADSLAKFNAELKQHMKDKYPENFTQKHRLFVIIVKDKDNK